ncbi:MAG: MFS transporter [Armatimonadetes bacterium]|nr:MFS transporter [Armatimonadota bacterium]
MSQHHEHRGLSPEFWRANLANLLILTGSVMFVLLPACMEKYGMRRWEIGLADGSFWLISVFVQPWLGPRLDKDGRKFYLVCGSLLMGVAAACYAVVPIQFVPMLLLRTIHGLGFAMYLTSSWTWVADYSPPGRVGELFGIFGISGLVSGAIGPAGAELVRAHFEYDGLFLAGSSLIISGALLTTTLKDRTPELTEKVRQRIPNFFRLIATRAMRGTALGSMGFGVAIGSLFAFVAPYLQSLDIAGVGGLFACTTLASGASRVIAGRQTDVLGPARLVVPALLLLAVGSFGIGQLGKLSHSNWVYAVLVASGLSAGIGYGAVYPALNALALDRLALEARGRGLSVVTAAIDLGSTAGAALAGVVAHNHGYPTGFVAIAGIVGTFAVLFALVEAGWKRKHHRLGDTGELSQA